MSGQAHGHLTETSSVPAAQSRGAAAWPSLGADRPAAGAGGRRGRQVVAFHGEHQAGIDTAAQHRLFYGAST